MNRRPRLLGAYPVIIAGVLILGVQVELGASTRFAPSDLLLGTGFALLLFGNAIISRYIVVLWLTFASVVSIGLVVGAQRGSISDEYWSRSIGIAALLAAAVCGNALARRLGVGRAITWLLAGMVITNGAGLLNYYTGIFTYLRMPAFQHQQDRYAALLVDANNAGIALGMSAAILLIYWRDLPWSRSLRWTALISLLLGLALTGSRGGFMALVIGLAMPQLGAARRIHRIPRFGGVALVVVIGLGFILFGTQTGQQVSQIGERPDTVAIRIELADDAFKLFRESPILGGGLGSTKAELGRIPHSTPQWLMSDLGLLGLAGGIIALYLPAARLLVRASSKEIMAQSALIAGLFAMVAGSLSIEASYQRHWWFLIGVSAAALRGRQRLDVGSADIAKRRAPPRQPPGDFGGGLPIARSSDGFLSSS